MARHSKTQDDIAELLNLSRQAISRRMLGHIQFRVDELQKIAELLNVSVSDLLGEQRASA